MAYFLEKQNLCSTFFVPLRLVTADSKKYQSRILSIVKLYDAWNL